MCLQFYINIIPWLFLALTEREGPSGRRSPLRSGWHRGGASPPSDRAERSLLCEVLWYAMSVPAPGVARGPVRETTVDAPCPVCDHHPLALRSLDLDLPYFGEALQTTLVCPACGYRHGDLLLTRSREPIRATLRVERPEHLSARVARSSSGTIRIPELEAVMEPGPRAEAFVSNVEGVLRKFLDVILGQEAVAADPESRARLSAVRSRVEAMMEAREPFTFVLEDPTGNSDVLQEDVRREILSKAEAARLKSSEMTFDLSEVTLSDEEE